MFLLTLLLAFSPVAQVNVYRVAPGGAGTHTNIQTAINAAVDGDIILVDSSVSFTGTPTFATIDGLSLTIIGDGPSKPELPVLVVQNLPAEGEVVLRNLDFASNQVDFFTGGVLAIRNCEGSVLVEDCQIDGFDSDFINGGLGGPALFVSECEGVSFVNTSITGGHGSSTANILPVPVTSAGHGARAARVSNSSVSFHGCTISGGHGGNDFGLFSKGGGGGLGLDTQNARLWVVGCTVTGGEGGVGSPPGTSSFGGQIDGINAPSTDFRQLDSDFLGGTGMPGLVVVAGSQTQLPGEAIDFSLSSPVRPTEIAEARVSGPPGTLFGLFLSAGVGFSPKDKFNGVWVSDLASFSGPLLISTLPMSGEFVLPFQVPSVGGLDGFLNVDQVLSQQAGGELVLSNASAWVQIENDP